jgi:diguanylate cyclase (GGDEF)-like protein
LAYVLVDIDHFKPFNDTFGHQKGDEVLISIATVLRNHFPYSFRIGGDEFAALITVKNEEILHRRLNALQQALKALSIQSVSDKTYLTCSIGAHLVIQGKCSFEEVYALTDQALYEAKLQGRDTIVYL